MIDPGALQKLTKQELITPMGCIEDAGRWYIKDHAGWQKGFGVFMVGPGGTVHHYPVVMDNGMAVVEGRVFKDRAGQAVHDKDVRSYWLQRFGLKWEDYV